METLHFSIDGSYLTELARVRYWQEDNSYEDSFNWLAQCLGYNKNDSSKEMKELKKGIHGILTGTKKLVGINEFSLEDDDKEEEYQKYLNKLELARRKAEFKESIKLYPTRYIDWFATSKSIKAFEEWDCVKNAYSDRSGNVDWYRWFVKDLSGAFLNQTYDFDNPEHLWGGCYTLLDGGELAGELCNWKACQNSHDTEEFQNALTEYWAKWLTDHGNKAMLSKDERILYKAIEARQARARLSFVKTMPKFEKPCRVTEAEKEVEAEKKLQKKKISHAEATKNPIKVKFWDATKYCCGEDIDENGNWTCYWAEPDETCNSDYGIIAPNGDFYACDFAGHLSLATHLIERDPVLRDKFNNADSTYDLNAALDFLFNIGYIATRNPFGGEPYIDYGKYTEDTLPQRVLDTCFDWEHRHDKKNY